MQSHSTGLLGAVLLAVGLLIFHFFAPAAANPLPNTCWKVDDLRPGMKGYGRSVFKGDKIERFDAEVLGVLKNVNPGRDLVLMRLTGCNLDKTGVIAGMSGSPVYIDEKLVGAVSYAWSFGTEPIAGVTPFCQMVEYAEAFEKHDVVKGKKVHVRANERPRGQTFPLAQAIEVGGQSFASVTVSQQYGEPTVADGICLQPLMCPLAAGNFTPHSLSLLRERTRWAGLLPMQAGSAPAHVLKDIKDTPLEPGSPLAVAMVRGDFDLSGIGTVTQIEGERVYGWGHPFMSMGACELPLMSGYIHTVYPRQTVSFKMGSPVQMLGVINADVSTGIAGWLGRKPDLMPLQVTVRREPGLAPKIFHCEVVRQKALVPQLVYAVLTNSVDMEGDLPEELTAEMDVRFEFEDRPPLVLHDTYSGSSFAGGRAPSALYSQIASMVHTLCSNPFEMVRIKKVECDTRLSPGRSSADIESVQLDSETYAPGDTIKGTAFVKPYKGTLQRVPIRLRLPSDMAPGTYTALVCDDLMNTRYQLRDSPTLYNPTNLEQVLQALDMQASAQRTHLVVRVALNDVGVAVEGQELPNLPASMVEMLANGRRTGGQTLSGALVHEHPTEWVIQGSQSVKFTVTRNKRLSTPE